MFVLCAARVRKSYKRKISEQKGVPRTTPSAPRRDVTTSAYGCDPNLEPSTLDPASCHSSNCRRRSTCHAAGTATGASRTSSHNAAEWQVAWRLVLAKGPTNGSWQPPIGDWAVRRARHENGVGGVGIFRRRRSHHEAFELTSVGSRRGSYVLALLGACALLL